MAALDVAQLILDDPFKAPALEDFEYMQNNEANRAKLRNAIDERLRRNAAIQGENWKLHGTRTGRIPAWNGDTNFAVQPGWTPAPPPDLHANVPHPVANKQLNHRGQGYLALGDFVHRFYDQYHRLYPYQRAWLDAIAEMGQQTNNKEAIKTMATAKEGPAKTAKKVADNMEVAAAPAAPAAPAPLMNIHKHLYKIDDGLNIILIGAGGTGGFIIPHLMKILGGVDKAMQTRLRFIVVEGDEFEPKNLGRQNCIPQDMGKNKGEVLVNRYGRAFNVPSNCAMFVDKFMEAPEDLEKLLMNSYTNVIIDCVDKNKPRKLMLDVTKKWVTERIFAYVYTISCGNGEWAGQVALGAALKSNRQMHLYKPGKTVLDEPYHFSIPHPFIIFPELVDLKRDEEEEAMNCAERAAANVQTMMANMNAATHALNYINSMITQFLNQVQDKEDMPQTVGTIQFNARNNHPAVKLLTDEYLAKEVF